MSTIPYLQIPARLRVPGVYIEQTSTLASTGERLNTALHLGYARGGKSTSNKIYQVDSLAKSRELFGANSMLAEMAAAHFSINKSVVLYQVEVPPPEVNVAAKGEIKVRTQATTSGVLSVRIADRLVSVAVAKNETAAEIATALATAIRADLNGWVTAESVDDVVNLESKVPGALGNTLSVLVGEDFEETPPIAVTVSAMTGGAGVPDLSAALAAMAEDPYDYIVTPFVDNNSLLALDAAVAERWDAMAAFNIQSIVFGVANGWHENLLAKGAAQNSEFISLLGVSGAPQAPWVWAASLVAVASQRLTNDPSAPIVGAEIPGLKAPNHCANWKQRNELLYSGISTFTANRAGNVYIEKLITTYQRDAQGYPDASYLSIHVLELMRNIRRVQQSLLATTLRGFKLTDYPEQHTGGQKITSIQGIRATLIGIYDQHLVGERSWCTDKQHYLDTIRVERDPDNRTRINYHDEPVMIGQLEIIAGQSDLQHG